MITAGIDVGSNAVKCVVVRSEDNSSNDVIGRAVLRVRGRGLEEVILATYEKAIEDAGLTVADVNYVATTGEGEGVEFRTGHFYSMTTHARGGLFLIPEARAALDIGALHGRVIRMDERGKVLDYRMTSQCASGSGQFLENISRYLGVALDEVGPLSQRADDAEVPSGICAVLAETDVNNMVSRGITTANILKGIHLSMAGRLVKLLKSAKVTGIVAVTGGLAADTGLVAAMAEVATERELDIDLRVHPDSALAGAIGAAIWGAFRSRKLAGREGATVGSA